MENRWLNQLKQLRALATTGLRFAEKAVADPDYPDPKSHYERDRYEEILTIVMAMLADLGDLPVAKLSELLLDQASGYETPKVDVRAAVIKDNKILLVQEKTDRRWSLPGGYADVGLSAAENAVKEVREEAGIRIRVKNLYALRHKAKGAYPPDVRDFYKIFFLCEQLCDADVVPGSEALDAGFFALNALPELSLGRVLEEDLKAAFDCLAADNLEVYFDQ